MKFPRIGWWLGGVAAVGMGCGSGDEETSGGTPKAASVSILVDANRDGYVNDLDAAVDRSVWNKSIGAAFLPNLDDDDLDKTRDAEDEVVNGNDTDAFDLARIFLRAFSDAPEGATGTLTIDAAAAPYVRVFRFDAAAGSWTKVLDATATSLTITEAEVRNGAQFGIEGRTISGLPDAGAWSGFVQLDYTVSVGGKPVATSSSPDGHDTARMRVAPWMMVGNSTPHIDTEFASSVSKPFVADLDAAIADANAKKGPVAFWQIKNWPSDQWTEDFFQTGIVSVPWADGNVAGMRLSMPRPWGRVDQESYLPVSWLKKSHLFQDSGYFVVYKKAFTGSTYDSHGNHDLVPPYTRGDISYPYGRIVHGSGVLPETHAFYEAQEVQAPVLTLDTSWLYVGHVDEFVTYVPAATPRGWKLLVSSTTRAVALLKEWQKQGHGAEKLFVGKKWSDGKSAAVSIDAVLADADLMAANQAAQASIDANVEQFFKGEIGLTDDEIVELPVLFEAIPEGGQDYMLAYSPDLVNLRAFNGWVIVPKPFGPAINGKDGLMEDAAARLGTDAFKLGADGKGLNVFFADDWDYYHALAGSVHCGSNQEAAPQPEWMWWKRMQTMQGVSQ